MSFVHLLFVYRFYVFFLPAIHWPFEKVELELMGQVTAIGDRSVWQIFQESHIGNARSDYRRWSVIKWRSMCAPLGSWRSGQDIGAGIFLWSVVPATVIAIVHC